MRLFIASAVGLALSGGCGMDHGAGGLPAPPKGNLDVKANALFVALGSQGVVAVIDVDAWTIAGTVKLSQTYQPHHLSLSPDRTLVGVGAPAADLSGGHSGHGGPSKGGALYIMDSRTGDVTAQSLPGGTAHNIAFLPDGSSVAFALLEHGMAHLANPMTLKAGPGVSVGAEPLEVTSVPGTKVLLVAVRKAGAVAVFDSAAGQITGTLAVGQDPIGAWLGSNGKAYVTSESDRKVSVIDLATLTVTTTITLPGTPGQVVTTTDGKEVWIALEDAGKVIVLAAADLAPIAEIIIGQRPHGLAVDPAGKVIYLTDESGGTVHELDVLLHKPGRSLTVGGAPNGIVFRAAL